MSGHHHPPSFPHLHIPPPGPDSEPSPPPSAFGSSAGYLAAIQSQFDGLRSSRGPPAALPLPSAGRHSIATLPNPGPSLHPFPFTHPQHSQHRLDHSGYTPGSSPHSDGSASPVQAPAPRPHAGSSTQPFLSPNPTSLRIGHSHHGHMNLPLMGAVGPRGSYDDGPPMHGQPYMSYGAAPTEPDFEGSEPANKRQRRGSTSTSNEKRKEQNRAAQRAFRERKEKYVRALEEKVQAQSEEINSMRELLGRLQSENVRLRQDAGLAPPSPTAFQINFTSNVPDPRNRVAPVPASASVSAPRASSATPYGSPPASATHSTFASASGSNASTRQSQQFSYPGAPPTSRPSPAPPSSDSQGQTSRYHPATSASGQAVASPSFGQQTLTQTPSPPPEPARSVERTSISQSRTGSSSTNVTSHRPSFASTAGGPAASTTTASVSDSPPTMYDTRLPRASSGVDYGVESGEGRDSRSAEDPATTFDFTDDSFLTPMLADVFNRAFPAHLFTPSGGSSALSPVLGSIDPSSSSSAQFPGGSGSTSTSISQSQSHPQAQATVDTTAPDYIPPPLDHPPCDKPECDFSGLSCNLPPPWAPPSVAEGTRPDELVSCLQAWAKLVSHPRFSDCDVDTVCTDLRAMAMCAVPDGENAPSLVVSKEDLIQMYLRLGERADRERRGRTGASRMGDIEIEDEDTKTSEMSRSRRDNEGRDRRRTGSPVGSGGVWASDAAGLALV